MIAVKINIEALSTKMINMIDIDGFIVPLKEILQG